MSRGLPLFLILLVSAPSSRFAPAQVAKDDLTTRVGFDQKLGDTLPLELAFSDESGREIRLGDLFGERPVILVPVYYRCPLLCNQVLNGLTRSLRGLRLDPGSSFDVVAFSIDPLDTPELAGRKRSAYLELYDRPGTEKGWHFLVGGRDSIERLSAAVGFRYVFDPATKLYTHAAGIVLVTPRGQIARYFYGLEYPPKELKAELERAARGGIGSPIARMLLLCYDYDAATGKYTLSIVRLIRALGTVTALSLGMFLVIMFRRERRERLQDPAEGASESEKATTRPLD